MMKKDATALDFGFLAEVIEQPVSLRVRVGNPAYPLWQRALKRTVDLSASILVMSLGAPVFLFLATVVKLSSPGPVFFRQVRLGRDGKPFVFYKFRSMRHNNDDGVHRDFARDFFSGDMPDVGERSVF
jgi:lipopolysaccharide/colanic/teichoic acid biosynthesis glycosyltransferase